MKFTSVQKDNLTDTGAVSPAGRPKPDVRGLLLTGAQRIGTRLDAHAPATPLTEVLKKRLK